MHKTTFLIAFAGALFAQAQTSAPADFYAAIRANDLAKVRSLAADTYARDTADGRGMTPLHFAATFGSTEAFRALVDAGANVNAKTEQMVTPLHMAAWDPARVKMLLDKGADANVVSKQGRTPLMVAANYPGAEESLRLLLAKTKNVNVQDQFEGTALMWAVQGGNPRAVKMLLDAGADPSKTSKAIGSALNNYGSGDIATLKMLLAKHTPVNSATQAANQVKNGEIALKFLTPLMLAAPYAKPEAIKALLDAGADVNAKDVRGMTPLMLAVSSENQDARVAKLLVARGAKVNDKSNIGETALDWANKFKNPDVIAALKKAGATCGEPGAAPKPAGAADLSKSVALLQTTTREFFRASGCVGCHHQPLTSMALKAARAAKVPVDEGGAKEDVKIMFGLTGMFGPGSLQSFDPPGFIDMVVYPLFGLGAAGAKADFNVDALVAYVAAHQTPNGGWDYPIIISRAPIEESNISRAVYSVNVLRNYRWPARAAEFDIRIERAKKWLQNAKAVTAYDRAEQLMGLRWAGASDAEMAPVIKALLAHQRADGGWSQNAYLESDAYATGLAIYALREAGVSNDAIKRGRDYLRKTQLADGSWYVRSRAPKFQPYFEAGFPHGHDQWISAPATAWAVAALAGND